MSSTIGIIGLPNVGKSTIFNTLADTEAPSSNYPFCTIEPNIGIVDIPDERLVKLKELTSPKGIRPTMIKFMDLAGLIKGSSQGEGLDNRFLTSARDADALLHIVRCFEDSDIAHVENDLDPERDIDIINIELCLADLEITERRIEKISRIAKSGDKSASRELKILEEIREDLKRGKQVKKRDITLPLLTNKPMIYLANTGEKDTNELLERIAKKAALEGAAVIKICGKLEKELKKLPKEEQSQFRHEWTGESESAFMRLIQACYKLLDLVTFYTIAKDIVSSWSINKGDNILDAARKVHSDMQHGFIKAEVINYKEFREAGSYNKAREKGAVKIVGKDYIVLDGDIIYIHFAKR